MANRPKAFGLSHEVAQRMDAKYSEDDEREVVAWIRALIGEGPPAGGKAALHAWLQDGMMLYKIMEALGPGVSKKPKDPSGVKLAAMRKNKEMENISFFLTACEKYGVGKADLFQTVDLYEAQNMAQVLTTMYKLSSASIKQGFTGPAIGVTIATENKRDHNEQKLKEGRNIIGLQMGTNQVASQQGMTPYGLGRQVAQPK